VSWQARVRACAPAPHLHTCGLPPSPTNPAGHTLIGMTLCGQTPPPAEGGSASGEAKACRWLAAPPGLHAVQSVLALSACSGGSDCC